MQGLVEGQLWNDLCRCNRISQRPLWCAIAAAIGSFTDDCFVPEAVFNILAINVC